MMTNLASERSPIKMLSGKRLHEYSDSGARFFRGFKRPRFSTIREFLPDCGAAAFEVRNEWGTLVKTSNERSKTEQSKPIVEVSRTKLNSDEPVLPVEILPHDLKSKSTKQLVKLLPNDSVKAPALHGNTLLKNEELGLLRVVEKVELTNLRNNNAIPKHLDMLCSSETSPKPSVIFKKYPSPKFRKGITIFRDFPRGCGGRDCLPLKHVGAESNFLGVEAGRNKALPDQHNGALSVKQLDNLTIKSHHEASNRTKEVLDMFEQVLKESLRKIQLEKRSTCKKNMSYIYIEAAMVLKKQKKWIYMNQKLLGVIPGVEVGDQFRYRAELVVVGLHAQFSCGIDYMEKDGKKIATSIVSSGRYSNDKEFTDVLIYSGQGGSQIMGEKSSKDQALVRGNLALKNSMDEKSPVRVILGRRSLESATYTYDGLYLVSKFWQKRAQNGKLVYVFQLNRMLGQPKLNKSTLQRFGKSKAHHCRALINDISEGEEEIHIRVINDLDNDKPPTFKYITKMVYPQQNDSSTETSGCHCSDGCSNPMKCSCIIKNGGMIPFNENGTILEAKRTTIAYQCGPSCKCPPSCKNRKSQHGIKFQLEVFKTKAKGWGVRSRNFITSGSFICEYVGELLNDKQAEERMGLDEYLFDIGQEDGFVIDAQKFGNIGRFVNHSCSPNLYAQEVLYDHNDKMKPHVMLFAAQTIRPLQELTYDYNYKIDSVHDSNGNVKKKPCYCGVAKCTGRMY
ncbi:histone H3-K9 methyltransferase [Heracleum sosnowskyi]|uniref:Histone H3-K9 methyltransferase n=1 Tax=Heracleum sosnowskyi TaxID=360622 RepID=A0AAD8HML0_9APIA|nr:histone H3-K9 methyltransferase [Heracleum sosnowskyi]